MKNTRVWVLPMLLGAAICAAPCHCYGPVYGPLDDQLQLSADGQTLAWLRIRGKEQSICTLSAPFTGKRNELQLGPSVGIPGLCLSTNGRHIFWLNADDEIWHAPITRSQFGEREELPFKSVRHLQCNASGNVLALLVHGNATPTRWPGYRALVTAERYVQGWRSHAALTPRTVGKLAGNPLFDDSGQFLVYEFEGMKQARRERDGDWQVSDVRFPGYHLALRALSADGKLALLQGCRESEMGPNPNGPNPGHVWVAKRDGDTWGKPELLLQDQHSRYYHLVMSPNGKWLAWIEFDRAEDHNTIVRERVRTMHRGWRAWGKPRDVLDQEGCSGLRTTAVADQGTIAWVVRDPTRGRVCQRGGRVISLE